MRFSQKYGYKPAKDVFQLETMDSDLRNSLWNALEIHFWKPLFSAGYRLTSHHNRALQQLCTTIWADYFKWRLTSLPVSWSAAQDIIHKYFFSCPWHEVYDFIEFMAQKGSGSRRTAFEGLVNFYLEREVSAYRILDGNTVRVTDPVEIGEIQGAIEGGGESISQQLHRSLQLLSDRESPDYRNSVKESISAVEAQVRATLGSDKGTLGDLLKRFDSHSPIHPALKEAFSRLYGYSSDESGIRHALTEGSREVTFDEAKFMLVTCSAFINYVRGAV
ncbi:MAG: hypothetical protein F4X66_09165 [Chloroflexi bacterium]|nr:hypothetical protein [Chloroflexota bacterium]